MVDLVSLIALLVSAGRSARGRFPLGVVCAFAAGVHLVAAAWIVLAHLPTGHAELAAGLIVLGPTTLGELEGGWRALVVHPASVPSAGLALTATAALVAIARARPLYPQSTEAVRLHSIAKAFVAAATFCALRLVAVGLMWLLSREPY